MSTTPLTELLAYYRRLGEPGNCGLKAHLALAQQLAREPNELVALFTRSLTQFARYSNPTQFFHEGELVGGWIAAAGDPIAGACASVISPPPAEITRSVHFAQWLRATENCEIAGRPELAFRYIDRELDCLRTSPGQLLEDGTQSKRALVLDLLIENKMDAIPILAELKIRRDEDALYGFIQCLSAAAHLVTAAQRTRLRNVYGLTSLLRNSGPYLDLYVIFFEPEVKGLWPKVLRETLAVRDGLMKQAPITSMIRRVEFLHAALGKTGLKFTLAEQILSKPLRTPAQADQAGEEFSPSVRDNCNYPTREKRRLVALGGPSLYPDFRKRILAYYREQRIAWWGSGEGPTESPISSQVACINHLEPARLHRELALNIARKHMPEAIDALPVEGGFLAYEWIGARSYLNERGWSSSSRGRNVTSLDAVMAVKRDDGSICLFVIEWKYTESYGSRGSLAVSDRGTSRVEIYRPLLERADSPIRLGEHDRLFFDPFDQLMRQTLFAWQMVEHREFGATEWIHLHVAPAANVSLLETVTSPQLAKFGNMESAWRSVLVQPERYALVTPDAVIPDVAADGEFGAWRDWLRTRYGT